MLKPAKMVLTLLLVYLVTACGGPSSQEKWLVGFSQCNSAEPWREAMNKEMKEEADLHPGLELIITDAQQDNSRQVADVENFIIKEVDLLVISPNEAQPLTAIVEKAFAAGIPVIVLDRKILSDQYTVFIGADNVLIGETAGLYAASMLAGRGNIVEIWGLKGSTPAQERHEGFMKGISGYPDIHILYEQDGAWLRRKGREIMENALQRFEQIDLVYAHNDPMAMGAFLAARGANRHQNMAFVGIDGLPGPEGGAQSVLNGELNATFLYPTGGREAVLTALKILDGEPVPKTITLETATITRENARQYVR